MPVSSNLSLGTLVLVVQSTTRPALNFSLAGAVSLRTTTLNKGQFLAIWIAHVLQTWRGLLVGQQMYPLSHCLWEVVGSLCHVIGEVILELVEPTIVGAAEQHA